MSPLLGKRFANKLEILTIFWREVANITDTFTVNDTHRFSLPREMELWLSRLLRRVLVITCRWRIKTKLSNVIFTSVSQTATITFESVAGVKGVCATLSNVLIRFK